MASEGNDNAATADGTSDLSNVLRHGKRSTRETPCGPAALQIVADENPDSFQPLETLPIQFVHSLIAGVNSETARSPVSIPGQAFWRADHRIEHRMTFGIRHTVGQEPRQHRALAKWRHERLLRLAQEKPIAARTHVALQ